MLHLKSLDTSMFTAPSLLLSQVPLSPGRCDTHLQSTGGLKRCSLSSFQPLKAAPKAPLPSANRLPPSPEKWSLGQSFMQIKWVHWNSKSRHVWLFMTAIDCMTVQPIAPPYRNQKGQVCRHTVLQWSASIYRSRTIYRTSPIFDINSVGFKIYWDEWVYCVLPPWLVTRQAAWSLATISFRRFSTNGARNFW